MDGKWMVFGPGFPTSLLTILMLAKVPLAMTASLPRLEPYELNSLGVNLQQKIFKSFLTIEEIDDLPSLGKVSGSWTVSCNAPSG
jgi:hypothetical protein